MKLRVLVRRILLKVLAYIDAPMVSSHAASVSNTLDDGSGTLSDFILDEDSEFTIQGTPSSLDFPRWMPANHCEDKRLALVIVPGECLHVTKDIEVVRDTRLFIRFTAALNTISNDGLTLDIGFDESGQPLVTPVSSLCLFGGKQSQFWREVEYDLSYLAGRRGRFVFCCCPGENNDPTADWLAMSDICITQQQNLSQFKARAFHELRSRNEIEHFDNVYRHSMYSDVQNKSAELANANSRQVRKLSPMDSSLECQNEESFDDIQPVESEPPYAYATRLLASAIQNDAPDFLLRLQNLSKEKKVVKVLSLCSGAARIEAEYARAAGANVEWALMDINPDLLNVAATQFAPELKLDVIEANVNDLKFCGEKWDVILCVSGLHHIVELESLFKFCYESLNVDGELWSIGEYIGRNGTRLWPEAKIEADQLFKRLPEKYRFNQHTKTVNDVMPDNDCSVGCFEAIRSEDIETLIDRWFFPWSVYRRNCFLWRLTNLAYCDNYDLENAEDLSWIRTMVSAELKHYRSAGRGTELFGVYKRRLF